MRRCAAYIRLYAPRDDQTNSAVPPTHPAVTVALCQGVVHPFSSGMGGGAFILISMANGTSEVVDAREQAPAAATERMYVGKPEASLTGGTAIAVPGELQGLRLAWERYGRAPWADNVLPVAALAESFVVSRENLQTNPDPRPQPYIALTPAHRPQPRAPREPQVRGLDPRRQVDVELAAAIAHEADALRRFEASSRLFLPGDRPPAAGATLANTALAATLRAVAARPDALTRGEFATQLLAEIAAAGGSVTADDLARYAPVLRAPLRLDVGGVTLLGVPPPSSGGAAVLMALLYLSLLPTPLATASDGLAAHLQVEALKQAFAMRMSLGDPSFVPDVQQVLDAMLSPEFNHALAVNHSDVATRPSSEYGGRYNRRGATLPPDGGTSHFSVVDAQRNAVAMTTTINTKFGSKVVSAATGIVFNNEMDDFSTPGLSNSYGIAPSASNFIRPGKRPLSSMAPTIVLQARASHVRGTCAREHARGTHEAYGHVVGKWWAHAHSMHMHITRGCAYTCHAHDVCASLISMSYSMWHDVIYCRMCCAPTVRSHATCVPSRAPQAARA